MSLNYNWPGWSLSKNPYGEHFDLKARKRMVRGSLKLLPYLKKYREQSGRVVLEVGPFFSPLVTAGRFPNTIIFYLDRDRHALKYLSRKFKHSICLFYDLNFLAEKNYIDFESKVKTKFKNNRIPNAKFDSIVISQVLNYINYKRFFKVIKKFLRKNGLIFINNVVSYGIPTLFSDKRPKTNSEIIKVLSNLGYTIVQKRVIKTPNKKFQKSNRLILIAKNNR